MTEVAIREADAAESNVRRAATGDAAAFARIVSAHHPSMARVAYAITGDVTAAEDSVQAAWAIAWQRLPRLRDHNAIGAWLLAIAANEARQALRRRRRHPVVDISAIADARAGGDPADGISSVDLARVLQRLDPDDRTLLALRFVGGLDSGAIATRLGLSASGVRSRLSRLIERLRAELDHA